MDILHNVVLEMHIPTRSPNGVEHDGQRLTPVPEDPQLISRREMGR